MIAGDNDAGKEQTHSKQDESKGVELATTSGKLLGNASCAAPVPARNRNPSSSQKKRGKMSGVVSGGFLRDPCWFLAI